jgi:hypothetical protein
MIKVKLETISRTNIGFPSEWTALTSNEEKIVLSYRYGKLNFIKDDQTIFQTEKHEFDLGGYMSDEDLLKLLKEQSLIA